jgi:uncharacterized DUF497 family protein
MHIGRLRWDNWNLAHIAAHAVEQDEAEAAVFGRHYAQRGREENRYEIYGQTEEGRYLFVVVDQESSSIFYVVTARDIEQSERRLYRRVMHK